MKISIAIPTYNRDDTLIEVLKSIDQQTLKPDEVIVVAAETNNTVEARVRSVAPQMDYEIFFYSNSAGLTIQRNRAIQEFKGDVLIFLDDDVTLTTGFLAQIKKAFNDNPEVVGVGGYIKNVFSKKIEIPWRIPVNLFGYSYHPGRVLKSGICLTLTSLKSFSGYKKVDFLPGSGMAYRREVFEQIQFNPLLREYGIVEDKEFSFRASRIGPLVIAGDAHYFHHKLAGSRPNSINMAFFRVKYMLCLWYIWFPGQSKKYYYQQIFFWIYDVMLRFLLLPFSRTKKNQMMDILGKTKAILKYSFVKPELK